MVTFSWISDSQEGQPSGSMYVERHTPCAGRVRPYPMVLVHGGGGQGTDWLATPDGRPGWVPYLVREGWTVFVVDRPGHGRSPRRTAAGGGPAGPIPPEAAARLFASGTEPRHTQWPGPGGPDDPAVRQLAAASTDLPADLPAAQALEGALLARLLDRIGTAVVMTHSLGSGAGWLAADARPGMVAALVAIEPAGPPFLHLPGTPLRLDWGLTAARLTYDPPVATAADLDRDRPGRLPGLAGFPIAVVEAEASAMGGGCHEVTAFLQAAGADAQHVRLADRGLHGNGHAVMLERNNRAVLDALLTWLEAVLPTRGPAGDGQAGSDCPAEADRPAPPASGIPAMAFRHVTRPGDPA